jgi:hypothetical protein
MILGAASAALLAGAEGEGHRSWWPGLVFGTGEVAVEHPADRVAGQVFQEGIDGELVGSGCPGLAGCQLP